MIRPGIVVIEGAHLFRCHDQPPLTSGIPAPFSSRWEWFCEARKPLVRFLPIAVTIYRRFLLLLPRPQCVVRLRIGRQSTAAHGFTIPAHCRRKAFLDARIIPRDL